MDTTEEQEDYLEQDRWERLKPPRTEPLRSRFTVDVAAFRRLVRRNFDGRPRDAR